MQFPGEGHLVVGWENKKVQALAKTSEHTQSIERVIIRLLLFSQPIVRQQQQLLIPTYLPKCKMPLSCKIN